MPAPPAAEDVRAMHQGRFYVITAAHCLPGLPPKYVSSSEYKRNYPNLLGPLDNGERKVWAELRSVIIETNPAHPPFGVLVGFGRQLLQCGRSSEEQVAAADAQAPHGTRIEVAAVRRAMVGAQDDAQWASPRAS